MPATTDDLAACVKRGAALLDRIRPGWAEEIALDELAMETCDRCIVGQLYGDYFKGGRDISAAVGPEWFIASRHGFTLPVEVQQRALARGRTAKQCFAPLARLWRAEVRSRTEVPS